MFTFKPVDVTLSYRSTQTHAKSIWHIIIAVRTWICYCFFKKLCCRSSTCLTILIIELIMFSYRRFRNQSSIYVQNGQNHIRILNKSLNAAIVTHFNELTSIVCFPLGYSNGLSSMRNIKSINDKHARRTPKKKQTHSLQLVREAFKQWNRIAYTHTDAIYI